MRGFEVFVLAHVCSQPDLTFRVSNTRVESCELDMTVTARFAVVMQQCGLSTLQKCRFGVMAALVFPSSITVLCTHRTWTSATTATVCRTKLVVLIS